MTIKENIDAERWSFAKKMQLYRSGIHGFPEEHETSLDRIEKAVEERIQTLETQVAEYERLINKVYMTVESGSVPEKHDPVDQFFVGCFPTTGLTSYAQINDSYLKGPFVDALRWDYFYKHFYEWIEL